MYSSLLQGLTCAAFAFHSFPVPPDEVMEADVAAAAAAPQYRGNGGRNAPAHYLPVAAQQASRIGARRDAYADEEMYGGSLAGGSRVIRTGGYDPSSTPQRMAERMEQMRIAAVVAGSRAGDGGGDDDEREWAAPASAAGAATARGGYDDNAEPEEQVV